MEATTQHGNIHSSVLLLVVEILTVYEQNDWPSPTIRDLSKHIGYSEETILESLEFGNLNPVSILQ